MKINWKQKLSSRKFWAAVGAWISSLLTAFNVTGSVIAQAGIIVSGIGALIIYIAAETTIDISRSASMESNTDDTKAA